VTAGLILGRHPGHTNHTSTSPPAEQPATQSSTDQQTAFDKSRFSTTDPASPWVVVNKQHPLQPLDYAPSDLTSIGNGQYMRAEAASALQQMFGDAQSAGLKLTAASGYRSYSTQVATYNSEVKAYGQARADSESARPGYSEHQTGWAVDIAGGGCYIEDCFGNTAEGKWAAANAYKYGFILRYTSANSTITGYRAEAWHFRYVGAALAQEMHKTGVTTLEQFFGVSGGATYL
jgi:D-alanyl-D-alanine carboxypeptidase